MICVAELRRLDLDDMRGLTDFFDGRLLDAAGRIFCLAVRTLEAFLARALPAGERLVAGLRRVDFRATIRLRDDED